MCSKAPDHAVPAREILFRRTNREDIDDENISVTGRTNSTSLSRCSSTYRSRFRSPPHPDEEGVLNLDTKSAKNAASDDSSAFNDVKPKPPSEHQSRLEEAYESSVEQQSSKAKSKKLSVTDDVEPTPPAPPHEENGYEKGLELLKNTKARRITHKDDSAVESYAAWDKHIMFLQPNSFQENLELLKNPLSIQSAANFQRPFPIPFPNTENIRLYQQFLYPYHTHSGSSPFAHHQPLHELPAPFAPLLRQLPEGTTQVHVPHVSVQSGVSAEGGRAALSGVAR